MYTYLILLIFFMGEALVSSISKTLLMDGNLWMGFNSLLMVPELEVNVCSPGYTRTMCLFLFYSQTIKTFLQSRRNT